MHGHSYALKTPMSPHASAEIDGIEINLDLIQEPKTENNLVIEGAGGLLVPLNEISYLLGSANVRSALSQRASLAHGRYNS